MEPNILSQKRLPLILFILMGLYIFFLISYNAGIDQGVQLKQAQMERGGDMHYNTNRFNHNATALQHTKASSATTTKATTTTTT